MLPVCNAAPSCCMFIDLKYISTHFVSGDQNGYSQSNRYSPNGANRMFSTLQYPHPPIDLVLEPVPSSGASNKMTTLPNSQQFYSVYPVGINVEMPRAPSPQRPGNRNSLMMVVPPSFTPMMEPQSLNLLPVEARGEVTEGPLCSSSPKRSASSFTTFGQRTPMSPTPQPSSGHLV